MLFLSTNYRGERFLGNGKGLNLLPRARKKAPPGKGGVFPFSNHLPGNIPTVFNPPSVK